MKKLKIIAIIVLILLVSVMFIGNCKKTNALSLATNIYSISERNQGRYNLVSVFDISTIHYDQNTTFEFFQIWDHTQSGKYLLTLSANNSLRLYSIGAVTSQIESVIISQRLLQIQIVYDVTFLYLIVYELVPQIQTSQGLAPSFDGFTRNMLFMHNLSSHYDLTDDWQQNDVYIVPYYNSNNYTLNGLVNVAYINATDSVNDINNWVDKQATNSTTINYILNQGYNEGYDQGYDLGYNQGTSDGEDVGYDVGYDEGYDLGYSRGTIDGHQAGYIDGYDVGYDIGYEDGQEGETAISPVFRIISDIFGSIGTIMAIELVPHVPLGLFILVPLFFSALGLILWIWRRN